MRVRPTRGLAAIARRSVMVALAVCLLGAAPATAARPLQTAIVDLAWFRPDASVAFAHARATGATAVRMYVSWRDTAPGDTTKPPGFDAANPAAPGYDWVEIDRQVRLARAAGLQPILSIDSAPIWAQGTATGSFPVGSIRPDPAEFANFGHAIAARYSGRFGGLPRVRYFQAWNEPNVYRYLSPQEENGGLVSPGHYKLMVNAFTAAVHSVRADDLVIAGALAPFTFGPASSVTPPLVFMRALLCLSGSGAPLPGCTPIHFDVWSHHPYTSGSPTHNPQSRDDASIPQLPTMHRMLVAAQRAGHVVAAHTVRFWVTEFSWDTNPPDPGAVPTALHRRWVAEALYRMWKAGVSLVTWFQLRDDPKNGQPDNAVFQSGLYFRCATSVSCDKPKPSLAAFRFPFVAFRTGGKVLVWGRTPASNRTRVTVEQRDGRRWKRLAVLRSDRYGIFTAKLSTRLKGLLRARVSHKPASVPFSLVVPPDFPVLPFGSPR